VTVSSPATVIPPPPPPSNVFTLKSSSTKKTGAVTLRIDTHAPGTAKVTTTFTETVRTKVGKGKHRRRKVTHKKVTYAHSASVKIGTKDVAAIKLKPTAAARSHLKSAKHEKVTLTVRFVPTGGSAASRKLSLGV
jgi:hypothetical protein